MIQLDSENDDRDLTSQVTVLTDTPNASYAMVCQGFVQFGDGTKNLDGSGGNFELSITVGGQTLEPDPQIITFSTAVRTAVWTAEFPVPANSAVLLKAKSPNAADSDVDVTATLYQVSVPTMIHEWHVAKTGNDSNGGHSFGDAYLTIGQAVTDAANGDTIIIWPGTYDEQVDLSSETDMTLRGKGWATVISKAMTSNDDATVLMGTGCRLENLKVASTMSGDSPIVYSVRSISMDRIAIDHCYLVSDRRAVYISGATDFVIKDGEIVGAEYALDILTSTGGQVLDCPLIKISGWTACTARACYIQNTNILFRNCCVEASRPEGAEADDYTIAMYLTAATAGYGDVVINNCILRASDGLDSKIQVLYATGARLRAILSNTIIHLEGTDTSDYGIVQSASAEVILNACDYDTTKTTGTITQVNSGWAAAVNAEADTALSDIKLDHLIAVADSDDVADDSVVGKLASTDGDWSNFSDTTDSLQSIRDNISDVGAGAGAITFTYTLKEDDGNGDPIADADIWITSDEAGNNIIGSGETDQNGEAIFYLDAGTVYVWRHKSGYDFTNPDTETVA